MVEWEKSKVKINLNFFSIMKTIIIVSNNPGKLKEYQDKLKGIKCIPYGELFPNIEIEETANTFAGNAYIKASTIAKLTDLACVADDSGLVVEALPNELGVHSKRFSNSMTDEDNNRLLLEKLKVKTNRSAYFHSTICLIDESKKSWFFTGELTGHILKEPRGTSGFGYDPLFEVDGLNQTLAELTLAQKNIYSHRAKAIDRLVEAYIK